MGGAQRPRGEAVVLTKAWAAAQLGFPREPEPTVCRYYKVVYLLENWGVQQQPHYMMQ